MNMRVLTILKPQLKFGCRVIFIVYLCALFCGEAFSQNNDRHNMVFDSFYFKIDYSQRIEYVMNNFDSLLKANSKSFDFMVRDLFYLNGEQVTIEYSFGHDKELVVMNGNLILYRLREFKLKYENENK